MCAARYRKRGKGEKDRAGRTGKKTKKLCGFGMPPRGPTPFQGTGAAPCRTFKRASPFKIRLVGELEGGCGTNSKTVSDGLVAAIQVPGWRVVRSTTWGTWSLGPWQTSAQFAGFGGGVSVDLNKVGGRSPISFMFDSVCTSHCQPPRWPPGPPPPPARRTQQARQAALEQREGRPGRTQGGGEGSGGGTEGMGKTHPLPVRKGFLSLLRFQAPCPKARLARTEETSRYVSQAEKKMQRIYVIWIIYSGT